MVDTKISDAAKRLERSYIAGMDEEFRDDLRVVLDALSQPAGLAGQQEFISDIYIVAGTPGMTPVDLADWIRDVLLRGTYALAATGKQQVGEAE